VNDVERVERSLNYGGYCFYISGALVPVNSYMCMGWPKALGLLGISQLCSDGSLPAPAPPTVSTRRHGFFLSSRWTAMGWEERPGPHGCAEMDALLVQPFPNEALRAGPERRKIAAVQGPSAGAPKAFGLLGNPQLCSDGSLPAQTPPPVRTRHHGFFFRHAGRR
jgi:hypothetical protein